MTITVKSTKRPLVALTAVLAVPFALSIVVAHRNPDNWQGVAGFSLILVPWWVWILSSSLSLTATALIHRRFFLAREMPIAAIRRVEVSTARLFGRATPTPILQIEYVKHDRLVVVGIPLRIFAPHEVRALVRELENRTGANST